MTSTKKLSRKKSEDFFGFDSTKQQDKRNVRHKGKYSYNAKNLLRIEYIKQKRKLQREEQQQKQNSPTMFNLDSADSINIRKR